MHSIDEIGRDVLPDARLFVAGQRLAGDGAVIERRYPATLELLAEFRGASLAQVEDAVAIAREAFARGPWPRMSVNERVRHLLDMAAYLDSKQEEIARLIGLDNGKTIPEQHGDVMAAIANFRAVRDTTTALAARELPDVGTVRRLVLHEPVGVVAAMTPFNAPLMFGALKVAPALAAGNTVILKPSARAPLAPFVLAEAAKATGLPAGVFQLLQGGDDVGRALTANPDVDMITITGGTASGSAVLHAAAEGIRKPLLELGGKSAHIVFADADLDRALPAVLGGIYRNSGQRCFSGSRLLLEDSIRDQFLERLVEAVRALRQGDPFDPATQVGAMVDPAAVEAMQAFVDRSRAEGAELLAGGERADLSGCFFKPTVLVATSARDLCAHEEVFGPVLTVLGFSGENQAIAIANDTRYGLAGGCWTRDEERGLRVARAVRVGYFWINTYALIHGDLPFGGYKASGLGREGGSWGIEEYTELKSVLVDGAGDTAARFD